MKKLAAMVLAFGCYLTAGSFGVAVSSAMPARSCQNASMAPVGQVPIYVYLEAIDRGTMNRSVGFALRRYNGTTYSMAGWARAGCWTTNLFRKRNLPRTLCITVRDGYRSLLKGGECQQWRMEGGRRIMVFRLIRQ